MLSPTGRVVAATLVALLSLSLVAPATGGPGPAGATADGERGTADRFLADDRAERTLAQPRERVSVSRTGTGGHASAVGTDAVLPNAPRNVSLRQRLALTPENPGQISVTHVFEVPEGVTTLKARAPSDATGVTVDGFTATDEGGYEWDGNTTRPAITYTVAVNETVEMSGPEGYGGRYLFVDAGAWALVQRPQLAVTWGWRGGTPVGLDRETTTNGPGFVGEFVAYLGAVDVTTRTAHGQTFHLVVPERATLSPSRERVLDALSEGSDRLRVGDRDDDVYAFAAPTTSVEWGVRGLQFGDADLWVRDAEALTGPDNTWFHEYAHTRQGYDPTASARWLDEATATYYGALLALETDQTTFADFRAFLATGTVPPQSGAVLTEPGTWANAANYYKGALVTGTLDRAIRFETDGTRSFGAVFSRLNAREGAVDAEAVTAAVEAVAGPESAGVAERYTTSRQVPEVWTATEHATAFGETPARFTYRVGDDDALSVTGPYRNGTIDSPATLYVGETLTVDGTVTNAGGVTAPYEQGFSVGGRVRATVSGTLAPGESASHGFSHTFETTGERPVGFGTDAVAVEVYDPATASVVGESVNRTELGAPGRVAVSVTVGNEFDAPAQRYVNVTRNDERVASRLVRLAPDQNRTVTVPVSLPDPGEYRLGVEGGETLTVTVAGDGPEGADGGNAGSAADGPGFGPGVALAALLALTVGATLRRGRR